MKFKFILLKITIFISIVLNAQIKLPSIISNGMILQRDKPINIWGWASASEKIKLLFGNKVFKTTTNILGKWKIILPAQKAGGVHQFKFIGKNEIVINDILFGDVYFCSGQSNMVHQLNIHDVLYANEIAKANDNDIRQFLIPTQTSLTRAIDSLPTIIWKKAVKDDVRSFSAVAYFYAKKLHDIYNIPIGIINASVGGTPIESWISENGFEKFPAILNTIQKNKDTAFVNSTNRKANTTPPTPLQNEGLLQNPKWYEINYVPKNWKNIAVPGYWEDQGIKELNGIVWYRKEINISNYSIDKKAKLFLGRIVDADVVYINGIKIGNTSYMYPQRRYNISNNILKEGKNTIVVSVTNNTNKGGFVPDKPYYLTIENDTIDLTGYWQYKVGEVFLPTFINNTNNIVFQNQPTALFNAMVAPVINYNIKGFVWYQGESNTTKFEEYTNLQIAQINNWRNLWQQNDLPFLYVQLPNYMDVNYLPNESQWANFREAQAKVTSVENTGMAVTIDLGEWNDIHPDNKKTVGDRLALLAQNIIYNEKHKVCNGPVFESQKINGNKIILNFKNIGTGLISNDDEDLRWFAIAGADKKFVWAKTIIENNTIIVWNETIANPLYVRFAWADNPDNVNFYNREQLPAMPFRTDK